MTEAEIQGWLTSIKAGDSDYSTLEPCAYKYFDMYNALILQYRYGEKNAEECKLEAKKLRVEYDNNVKAQGRYTEFNKKYQDNIKASDALMIEMMKSTYNTEDTLQIALKVISLLRGEEVSEKTILRRLGLIS